MKSNTKQNSQKPTTTATKPKKKPQKRKAIKFQKWKALYIELDNATEAAARVYNCKNRAVAAEIGHQNLRKLDFTTLLEEKGITDNRIIDKVSQGMEAQKVISSYSGKNADASTNDFIEVPDHAIQHKYTETALKLKGRLTKEGNTTNMQFNIQNIAKDQNEKYKD